MKFCDDKASTVAIHELIVMVASAVKTVNLSASHEQNQNCKIVFPPVFPRAQEKSWRKWNYVCKCSYILNLRAFCRSYVLGKHNGKE